MKTNLVGIFAALSMIGPLALLSPAGIAAQPTDTPEIRAAAQITTTPSDHEGVAKHYENVAVQVQVKYQNKSYLYGKQAQELQSHTEALIRDYEQTVTATIEEAATHRRMASKLKEKHVSDNQEPIL
jgi:hypothetical protein